MADKETYVFYNLEKRAAERPEIEVMGESLVIRMPKSCDGFFSEDVRMTFEGPQGAKTARMISDFVYRFLMAKSCERANLKMAE